MPYGKQMLQPVVGTYSQRQVLFFVLISLRASAAASFFFNAVPANASVCSYNLLFVRFIISRKKHNAYAMMPKGNQTLTSRTKRVFAIRFTAPFS